MPKPENMQTPRQPRASTQVPLENKRVIRDI